MIFRNTHIFSFYDCYVSLEKRREEKKNIQKRKKTKTFSVKVLHRHTFLATNFLKEAL